MAKALWLKKNRVPVKPEIKFNFLEFPLQKANSTLKPRDFNFKDTIWEYH